MAARPPLRDVAALAGVSEPTVSRVLNGKDGVAAATRERVLAALTELGFDTAATIGAGRLNRVGIITGELTNPVFPKMVNAISERLARHDYVASVAVNTTELHPEDRYVQDFIEMGVDGFVFVAGAHAAADPRTELYDELIVQGVPMVLVNGGPTGLPVPHVWCDESTAAERAIEHLASLGHRSIGCVLGPNRYLSTTRFAAGYDRVIARLGLEDGRVGTIETTFSFEGGRAGAIRLINAGASAVVCANDLMAMGTIEAARSLGLDVPADISVVGFDGTDFTATTNPPLTTMRQPFDEMGDLVADALLSEIAGVGRFRDHYVFAPDLVARRSTGAAAVSASV
ncbi:MAG: LacI family DNA-binding transcriptional regulator [Actinomycetota bacterium]